MRCALGILLGVGAVLATADGVLATSAADLCGPTADPCVVAVDVSVAPNSVIDLGSRALILRRGRDIDVGAGGMVIRAGRLTVEPGAVVGARGPTGGASGNVQVIVVGDVDIQADGTTKGRIDVGGDLAGGSAFVSAGGNVTIAGALIAQAGSTDGDGGSIDVVATGTIVMSGSASAHSGSQGGGGDISLRSGGRLVVSGDLDASGGDIGGGSIDLDARSTLSAGLLDVHGGGSSGDGGSVTITADGDITFTGQIDGTAAGTAGSGGGSGADIQVVSSGTIRLAQQIIAPGGTPDGDGGSVDMQATQDIILAAPIRLQGIGTDSCGGDLSLIARQNLSATAIDISGGSCGVGSVALSAGGTATLSGEINGDAGTAGAGATMVVVAEVVRIGAVDIHANAGTAGNIRIAGCTVGIPSGAAVEALGIGGQTLIQASGQLTLAGALRAGVANRLEYRSAGLAPIVSGVVQPPPVLALTPTLPVCQTSSICGNGQLEIPEACDDGNAVSCDGCSSFCRIEQCGNGVVECSEICDLGAANGTPGASCDTACRPVDSGEQLLIPGSSRTTGCFLEWALQNPNAPLSQGVPSSTQSCIDGDPSCDTDGANDGACAFRLSACIHEHDARLPDCRLLLVSSIELRRPLLSGTSPEDTAIAQQLLDGFAAFTAPILADGVVVRPGNVDSRVGVCTAPLSIRVSHLPEARGRRLITARAHDQLLRRSDNKLRLFCESNPAVCGNGGAPEVGEQCDDGNLGSCDGCSSGCRIEACGNGLRECAEECDDGALNGTAGNLCRANCTLPPPPLRIPGGGRGAAECALEWALAMGQPALNRQGQPDAKQECTDNDPSCDFDPVAGICRFHLWACAGGEDTRLVCPAATVESVTLIKPSTRQPGPLRDALLAGLGSLTVPLGPGEQCSQRIDVSIPATRRRVSVKATASSGGVLDKDGLRLRCNP